MCLLKKILPFILTLSLGIALPGILTHLSVLTGREAIESTNVKSTPLAIQYVPELDFSDESRRSYGFSASLKLQALLGADGSVSDITPVVMLPYGVTDASTVETGNMGQPTPAIMNGKFVRTLPYGLIETSIEAAKQIQFTPATKNGKSTSVMVNIVYEFNLMISPDCMECSSIITTIMDDSGVRWRGEIPRANAYRSYETY